MAQCFLALLCMSDDIVVYKSAGAAIVSAALSPSSGKAEHARYDDLCGQCSLRVFVLGSTMGFLGWEVPLTGRIGEQNSRHCP